VDCGAGVGYASAYLLTRFPAAKVIAVEPDPNKFSVLQANLAAYGDRCRTLCAAIWSEPAKLVLVETISGPRGHWRHRVRPAKDEEAASVTGQDLEALLRESGFERISILRINVGGAESTIFASGCERWIGKVDHLAVELHGPECRAAFMNAISSEQFAVSEFGEVTHGTKRP
jgi:FkbM family methyltransferase